MHLFNYDIAFREPFYVLKDYNTNNILYGWVCLRILQKGGNHYVKQESEEFYGDARSLNFYV